MAYLWKKWGKNEGMVSEDGDDEDDENYNGCDERGFTCCAKLQALHWSLMQRL
jgi:hypothetical protein